MTNKTILIVERDAEEAKRILEFFRVHDFRNHIELVHSKSEAMDYIFGTGKYGSQREHETPALILLDLLTNMTQDIHVLKPLQWYIRTQNIPIITLTSSVEQERQVDDFHMGSVGCVRKPLEFTRFIEVIQELGAKLQEQKSAEK